MADAQMNRTRLLVFDSKDALYQVAESYLRQLAQDAVSARGRFLLALSGGSTPLPLYRRLAEATAAESSFPWQQTHIFWGDERMVPAQDPESNYGQAQLALLDHVPIPTSQIYPIPGTSDPVTAAEAYADILHAVAATEEVVWPRFDLALLGLGRDGHTASLFPGSTFPLPPAQATEAVLAKYDDRPAGRVTVTPAVLNSARHLFFLVTGEEKAEALAATLAGEKNPVKWPAQRIQPAAGVTTWFADRAAAACLDQ